MVKEQFLGKRERVNDAEALFPEEYIIKPSLNPKSVASGIAVSPYDLAERRKIVTAKYLEAKYITENELVEGEYNDIYEPFSIPIVAKIGDESAASLRMIPNLPELGLPINNEDEIIIDEQWQDRMHSVPFEISQLAKTVRDPRPTLALIRTYFAYSRYLGESDAAGVIDDRVKMMMNGPFMSFGLPEVGPSVEYMGSFCTPIYINIEDVIENTAKAGHVDLATFLDTGKAKGFEWYQGM